MTIQQKYIHKLAGITTTYHIKITQTRQQCCSFKVLKNKYDRIKTMIK